MRRVGLALAVTAILGAVGLVAAVRADEEKVPLDKVPKAVLEAVKARFPDAKLESAEKETENGKTVYDVTIKDKDRSLEVEVTSDGKITGMERRIAIKDLPSAVTDALKARYPNATLKSAEEVIKVTDGRDKLESYEVVVDTGKKKFEVVVSPEGKILKGGDQKEEKD